MKRINLKLIALSSAVVVHGIFSLQALAAAPQGGMMNDGVGSWLFLLHMMLMYFLPPSWPISTEAGVVTIDWIRFCGKLAVALPASIAYGYFIAFAVAIIREIRNKNEA